MRVDEESKQEYTRAYAEWQKQLAALHQVLLEGKHLDPPRLKGLLNREVRAKERYEAARRRLLGVAEDDAFFQGVK